MVKPDVEMTFTEHLLELRRRIIWALLGILIGSCVCGVFYKEVMAALIRPYLKAWQTVQAKLAPGAADKTAPGTTPAPPASPPAPTAMTNPPRIILGSPIFGFMSIIIVTTVVGVFLASPWVVYQVWAFVGVGLREKEQRFVRTYGPVSFLLFVGGGATFYFLILPIALAALMIPTSQILVEGISLIDPSFMLDDYLRFIAWMTLIFGVCFQTPLVILFLARTGIVPLGTLARKQKIIIFALIVAVALIAPSGDPFTCTLMAIPLIVLYEFGLLLAWISVLRANRRKRLEEAQGGSAPEN